MSKTKKTVGVGSRAQSGAATVAVAAPAAPGAIKPWHLFVLMGLIASSAGALMTHGSTPLNIIFTCLGIFTAAWAGWAMYRTLAPLVVDEADEGPEMLGGRTRAALEREKLLVLRAIKDLEFDRAMGKVSEADCQEMIARLRSRAVRLIRQLDTGAAGYRELIEKELAARLGDPPSPRASAASARQAGGTTALETKASDSVVAPNVSSTRAKAAACDMCGTSNDHDARFCKTCGAKLEVR